MDLKRARRLLISLLIIGAICAASIAAGRLIVSAITAVLNAMSALLPLPLRIILFGIFLVAVCAFAFGIEYHQERISLPAILVTLSAVLILYVIYVIKVGRIPRIPSDWQFYCILWTIILLHHGTLNLQRKSYQARLDALGEEIDADLRRGARRNFALYVRPFKSTNAMNINPVEMANMQHVAPLDYETAIEREFPPSTLPLVKLGLPGEMRGGAQILASESEWWSRFKRLATGARIILILPSAQEGTFREITWLFQGGMMDKCIWLMPNIPPTSRYRVEWEWARSRERLAELGIHLPPYEDRCNTFRLREGSFEAVSLGEIIRTTCESLRKSIT